ncbi:glycoside hydrolase family 127 protein [Lysobacter yananisis]|uniref:Glycoside hydrolase family 127 protein n=1 Tax=Lysobacter yananisis TaxID=1003114 RepID=A0ABY9PD83_9GAMM|nr:beta-L-arabinofuranosidase domain-containing protein [Lysobacter yananisis]WMT04314.1 glycoside hydrolase family 127 protein [Lysobacter yananisis]
MRRYAPALDPAGIVLRGPLGEALDANLAGRLSHFIVDETSPAIALFAPERRARNEEGDWYGEHAGKWLSAAAKAAARSGDAQLLANLRRVADFLVSTQEADGYLGTYAPQRRFMRKQAPKPVSWDGAPSVRTWDIWTHAYLILGLLETHKHFPEPRYLDAARRIGRLCLRTLSAGDIDITDLGNHFGMSATVLLDPAVELYFATGEQDFLDLALTVLGQADAHPPLALLTRALAGADAAEIATGKAYQLAWNLVGLAKLHRASGHADYLRAVQALWRSIRERHLTLGGGPWGGVAHRSREVFNAPGAFSPQAYVETCSTLAWIQLNRELLTITGEARYAEEIERSAYNDLLAAQAPDGEDWCYYVFPNGRRVHTTYWRCCKSSGAMAVEEVPGVAYSLGEDGATTVNLYAAGSARIAHPLAGELTLAQDTAYPFDGEIRLRVSPRRAARFALRLRIPSWAQDARVAVNGAAAGGEPAPGDYFAIEREWRDGDEVVLRLPMRPVAHRALNRNVQESRAPDGSPVAQEVLRHGYIGFTCGPLVYATGLIDGFKSEETVRLPDAPIADWLHWSPPGADGAPPRLELRLDYRAPLAFEPYYRAGGRADGAWRLTWLSLAPPATAAHEDFAHDPQPPSKNW